jgi:hypothetical protein
MQWVVAGVAAPQEPEERAWNLPLFPRPAGRTSRAYAINAMPTEHNVQNRTKLDRFKRKFCLSCAPRAE